MLLSPLNIRYQEVKHREKMEQHQDRLRQIWNRYKNSSNQIINNK